jgi:hypothetical protein
MTQHPVPIDVAAATLSTTTAAIRKRIKRGTLAATKDGAGRWLIFLPESPSTEATRKAGQGCPDEVDAGLDAGSPIPDEGASARIAALEREAAVLRAELSATRAMVEQLQGERD